MTTRNNAHARAGIDAALAEIGKTAGHTPGPWILDNNNGAHGTCAVRFELPTPGRHTFVAVAHLSGTSPQREANARLIAAAPDLLSVTQHALSLSDRLRAELIRTGFTGPLVAELGDLLDEAAAAREKAVQS